jgi:hypothetical protein
MRRPERGNVFHHECEIEGDMPNSANSQPKTFTLRVTVREQIQAMLRDGILQESCSEYINPLTLVHREQKPIRISVDARRINKLMVPDRVKVQPMREMLLRLHGSSYIKSLDLSSAFLQVPLSKVPRKSTDVQFHSIVYQLTAITNDFKNSLSEFIRSLETILGDDVLKDYVITYVDDLHIHSSRFSDHLDQLDRVLQKPTTAGITINASKCNFCKQEIKFLGHIVCDKTVKVGLERIIAVLRYPVLKKQKQLRKFLGVCNFHQKFNINTHQT